MLTSSPGGPGSPFLPGSPIAPCMGGKDKMIAWREREGNKMIAQREREGKWREGERNKEETHTQMIHRN